MHESQVKSFTQFFKVSLKDTEVLTQSGNLVGVPGADDVHEHLQFRRVLIVVLFHGITERAPYFLTVFVKNSTCKINNILSFFFDLERLKSISNHSTLSS